MRKMILLHGMPQDIVADGGVLAPLGLWNPQLANDSDTSFRPTQPTRRMSINSPTYCLFAPSSSS